MAEKHTETLNRTAIYRFNHKLDMPFLHVDTSLGRECMALGELYISAFDEDVVHLPSLSATELQKLLDTHERALMKELFELEHTDNHSIDAFLETADKASALYDAFLKHKPGIYKKYDEDEEPMMDDSAYMHQREALHEEFRGLCDDADVQIKAYEDGFRYHTLSEIGDYILRQHVETQQEEPSPLNMLGGPALRAIRGQMESIALDTDSPHEAAMVRYANTYHDRTMEFFAQPPITAARYERFAQEQYDAITREMYHAPKSETQTHLNKRIAKDVRDVPKSRYLAIMAENGGLADDDSVDFTKYVKKKPTFDKLFRDSGGTQNEIDQIDRFMQYRMFSLMHRNVDYVFMQELETLAVQGALAKGRGGGRGPA